jgi:hypothetical protein
VNRVFHDFRTGFRGKVSPVHLFWGSFDLAVTRFSGATVKSEAACFDQDFGEFILPYETVRTSPDPESTLLAFLETTYDAAASLGGWDRSQECARGLKGIPLPID